MGSIGYFRTLNALMNLFSLFVCMTYFPYQNANVVEETLSASKSDAILFQTTLPLLQVLLKSLPHYSATLLHTTYSITNGSVG